MENVPSVLMLLDEKINSLKKITDSVYKTTGNLDGFGDLKVELKVENLIRAYSMIIAKEDAYNRAASDLGIAEYPAFNINGGSSEQWKHDILLRKAIIEHKQTLDTLQAFKDKMSKFLSAEDQKEILMKEMESFLSKG